MPWKEVDCFSSVGYLCMKIEIHLSYIFTGKNIKPCDFQIKKTEKTHFVKWLIHCCSLCDQIKWTSMLLCLSDYEVVSSESSDNSEVVPNYFSSYVVTECIKCLPFRFRFMRNFTFKSHRNILFLWSNNHCISNTKQLLHYWIKLRDSNIECNILRAANLYKMAAFSLFWTRFGFVIRIVSGCLVRWHSLD